MVRWMGNRNYINFCLMDRSDSTISFCDIFLRRKGLVGDVLDTIMRFLFEKCGLDQMCSAMSHLFFFYAHNIALHEQSWKISSRGFESAEARYENRDVEERRPENIFKILLSSDPPKQLCRYCLPEWRNHVCWNCRS